MTFHDVVDSIFKSPQQRLDGGSRADAFVFLFYKLKKENITTKDIGKDEINYIISKIDNKMSHNVLTSTQNYLIYMDIKRFSELILDDKLEVKKEIALEKPKTVFINDEEDTLDQEGYMDAPEKGPIFFDIEYAKFLGMKV